MATYTVHDAKTNLSKLIEQAEGGEDVVISRGDQPAVRLVPVAKRVGTRSFGSLKGQFEFSESFFDPLPEDALRAFEGLPPLKPGQQS